MRAKITIDLKKIRQNAGIILRACAPLGIEVAGVTKMHCGDIEIAKALLESGVKILADSRIENLEKFRGLNCEKWLLRLPSFSCADQVVQCADVSFNSESATLRALDASARKYNRIHGVILMFDLGDLREGYFNPRELHAAAAEVLQMKNIKLSGIATNLSCYGGVIPTKENLSKLTQIASSIENEFSVSLAYVSGGSSTSYSLVLDHAMPDGINNLRIGDAFYFGRDLARRTYIEGMQHDCVVLSCEIIEIKQKPSVPVGRTGFAALNRKPVFEDKGIRRRAICSVGRQDIDLDMKPKDAYISLMDASSDHLLVDITDAKIPYRVGDTISFDMLYTSAMRAFTSPYVDKEYRG